MTDDRSTVVRLWARTSMCFLVVCIVHRCIRSIVDAGGNSVRHATAGQLVKFTGVSRKSLRVVRDLAGGKDGGHADSIGGMLDVLPVGEHAFTFAQRRRMAEVADLQLLRLHHEAATVHDEYDDDGDGDVDDNEQAWFSSGAGGHASADDNGSAMHSRGGYEQELQELVSDSSILLKCDTAGSLRNALGCIGPDGGIHVVSGRIGARITKMDLHVRSFVRARTCVHHGRALGSSTESLC